MTTRNQPERNSALAGERQAANGRPIRVVVDHREAASGLAEALARSEGVAVEFGHLAAGDYEIDNRFVFERKTLGDLARSIQDGRLFQQALRLAEAATRGRAAIVLEGTSTDLSRSSMRREAIQGALITVTLFFGIPLLRSMDPEESARIMIYAARQARVFASGALPRHGIRPKGKHRRQMEILQGLPGVGPERARRLLERFGSVQAVVAAGAAELRSVEGIGRHTAQAIRWAVEEARPPYGVFPEAAQERLPGSGIPVPGVE